jgi:hypothetical protein
MFGPSFKLWYDQNLVSFESKTIFFYTLVDTLYILISILLFLVFTCFFKREQRVIILIFKNNNWYQNVLFGLFLLTFGIPNRVYIYNRIPTIITLLIYLGLGLLGYYKDALFWFVVIAFLFLSINSTFIGYTLGMKNGNINSFYTRFLFNNNGRLQKIFVRLFFGNPHGRGFARTWQTLMVGATATSIVNESAANKKYIFKKQNEVFKGHSENVGVGNMTPEQTLELRRESDKHVFNELASFPNKTLSWAEGCYEKWSNSFSKPTIIQEMKEESVGSFETEVKPFEDIKELKVLEDKLKAFDVHDLNEIKAESVGSSETKVKPFEDIKELKVLEGKLKAFDVHDLKDID